MAGKKSNVAVVIPAFCAEKSIAQVIQGIPEWVKDIFVIDDCSQDSTGTVVNSLKNPKVHLIRLEKNQGVGNAVLTGYQAAVENKADIIVKIDSDGQMDPKYIEKLIQPIESGQANYTKGNRFFRRSGIHKMPIFRKIGNVGLSFMIKMSSGYWNIFDPTNGYTAISAEIVPMLNFKNISRRFFFETSLLLELGLLRAVVKDIDIPAIYGEEKSHLSEIKALLEFPPKLVVGFFKRIVYLYFIRDFNAVSFLSISGFIGIAFGMIWGVSKWQQSSAKGMITPTGTVMIAVIPIIIGIQFLLQAMVLDIQNFPQENIYRNNSSD